MHALWVFCRKDIDSLALAWLWTCYNVLHCCCSCYYCMYTSVVSVNKKKYRTFRPLLTTTRRQVSCQVWRRKQHYVIHFRLRLLAHFVGLLLENALVPHSYAAGISLEATKQQCWHNCHKQNARASIRMCRKDMRQLGSVWQWKHHSTFFCFCLRWSWIVAGIRNRFHFRCCGARLALRLATRVVPKRC